MFGTLLHPKTITERHQQDKTSGLLKRSLTCKEEGEVQLIMELVWHQILRILDLRLVRSRIKVKQKVVRIKGIMTSLGCYLKRKNLKHSQNTVILMELVQMLISFKCQKGMCQIKTHQFNLMTLQIWMILRNFYKKLFYYLS